MLLQHCWIINHCRPSLPFQSLDSFAGTLDVIIYQGLQTASQSITGCLGLEVMVGAERTVLCASFTQPDGVQELLSWTRVRCCCAGSDESSLRCTWVSLRDGVGSWTCIECDLWRFPHAFSTSCPNSWLLLAIKLLTRIRHVLIPSW